MESDITDQQFFRAEVPLAEPHFDEEATLLSARPVVPLKEVMAETHSRRRLAFALAIIVALLVGAFSATLIYKRRDQNKATAVAETAKPASEYSHEQTFQNKAGGAVVDSDGSGPLLPQKEDGSATLQVANSGTSRLTREKAPGFSGGTAHPGRAGDAEQKETDTRDEYERELHRAERREARRLRRKNERAAKRETGGDKGQPDGLLRIREIFEGSPRP